MNDVRIPVVFALLISGCSFVTDGSRTPRPERCVVCEVTDDNGMVTLGPGSEGGVVLLDSGAPEAGAGEAGSASAGTSGRPEAGSGGVSGGPGAGTSGAPVVTDGGHEPTDGSAVVDLSEPPDEACTTARRGAQGYYFCPLELPWTAAREACLDAGGELAAVGDAAEDEFIDGELDPTVEDYWLGGVAEDGLTWRWSIDDSTFWPGGFADWATGAPRPDPSCVRVSTQTSRWHTAACTGAVGVKGFVCEVSPP